jgi:hypothetical protein
MIDFTSSMGDMVSSAIDKKWKDFSRPFKQCSGDYTWIVDEKEEEMAAFPIPDHQDLHGIIDQLTQTHGGNVHDLEIVKITSKSIFLNCPSAAPRNLALLGNGAFYWSDIGPGQWLCWDFGDRRVSMTKYAFLTGPFGEPRIVQSWDVQISVDGEQWTMVDRQTQFSEYTQLRKYNYTDCARDRTGNRLGSFNVRQTEPFRFLRFTMTEATKGTSGGIVRTHRTDRGRKLYDRNGEPIMDEREIPPQPGIEQLILTSFEMHGTITEG